MTKVTAAGYVCIDFYPDFENRCYVTGNGVDVLFNLLEIRNDLYTSIVSAISDDEYGAMCMEAFEKRHIDCSHLDIIHGGQTPCVPLYLKNNDRVHGKPVRGIMEDYQFSDSAIEFISHHDIIHSDFTGRLNHRLGDLKKHGGSVFFDLSNHIKHPDLKCVLSQIDCGLVSFEGNLEDGRDFLRYAHAQGAGIMVATFGKNGSLAYDGAKFYTGDIVSVKDEDVVNTVGAGDSYFAGFISAWIDGRPIDECMHSGAEKAAKVISVFEPYQIII